METEIKYIDINGVSGIGDVKYFGLCLWPQMINISKQLTL